MNINVGEILLNLWNKSGFAALSMGFMDGGWQNLVMIAIACVLLYLGIVKQFEPLLMVGIAFGCPWAVCTIRSCGPLSWIRQARHITPTAPSSGKAACWTSSTSV